MERPSYYDLVAFRILAKHLDAEVPYLTVSSVLDAQGWAHLIETIYEQYPQAYQALCAKHAGEIQEAIQSYAPTGTPLLDAQCETEMRQCGHQAAAEMSFSDFLTRYGTTSKGGPSR